MQAGKVSIHLEDMGHPDMVTIVGHKIGAPKVSPVLPLEVSPTHCYYLHVVRC